MTKVDYPIGTLVNLETGAELEVWRPYDICKKLGLSSNASTQIMANVHKKYSNKYMYIDINDEDLLNQVRKDIKDKIIFC